MIKNNKPTPAQINAGRSFLFEFGSDASIGIVVIRNINPMRNKKSVIIFCFNGFKLGE